MRRYNGWLFLAAVMVAGPAWGQAGKTDKAAPPPATSAVDPKPAETAKPAAQTAAPAPAPEAATAPAPAPTPPPAAKPAAAPAAIDGATYAVRLRELEARVDELKEQIRRSHNRLSLLSDTILSGGVGGARAEITFTNEMSSAFRLTRALFVLDGAVQYNKQDDTGALAAQRQIPIFSGSVPTGDHTLQVLIQLRGHGYGVFSYLRGYRFEVKSSHAFTVTEGKTIQLEAIAYEKGGVTTPLEQRPAIRYVEKVGALSAPGASPPPAAAQPRSGASGSMSIGTGAK
jgi:hypothetical protein